MAHLFVAGLCCDNHIVRNGAPPSKTPDQPSLIHQIREIRAIASSTANISGYRCVLTALPLRRLEEQFRQVGLVPTGFQAFVLDAELGAVIFEARESDVTQDGEILACHRIADTALILPKGDIEIPMQTVFDAPVTADRVGEARGVELSLQAITLERAVAPCVA